MLWSAQEISKKFRNALGKNISPRAINVFAENLGYHMKRIGGKKGYDQSLYTALTRHLKELLNYDSQQTVKTPQNVQKQQNLGDYYTYNGERDNVDYEWEKNEDKATNKKVVKEMKSYSYPKRIHINESQLTMLTEGNDNEKRARNYIRKSGVCNVGNPEIEDQLVHQLFDYIRNVFCSSDSKSYAYKHIQGITKLILGDGTPSNPGAFIWSKGQIKRDKNGLPQLDSKKLFSLRQRVESTAELEADNKMYDNSFRRLDTSAESNFNDFVDAETLPSMSEYMQGLLSKYTEFTTSNGYHILRIPNFNTANVFSQYIPGVCYLSHMNSYNEYVGREGKLFLALKPNCSDIEKTPMGKNLFHNGGKMNEYATSAIGIASTPVENKLGCYVLTTVTSRYDWHAGGTNFDYNFQELSNILGFDVLDFLHKEFPNERIALNIKGARDGKAKDMKFENKIWKKKMF